MWLFFCGDVSGDVLVGNPQEVPSLAPPADSMQEGLQPTVLRNSIFHDDHLSEILSATEKTCGYPYGGTLTFPSRIFFVSPKVSSSI